MMNPKKLIQAIDDSNRGRQERIYRLLVTIGLMGLAAGIISGVVAGENINNLIMMAFFLALSSGIVFFSVRYRKIQLGAVIISVLIIFLVLPFNFLTGGGIYGGAPVWFMFGVVFVCLVVEKKIKYVLIAGSFFIRKCLFHIRYRQRILIHLPLLVL